MTRKEYKDILKNMEKLNIPKEDQEIVKATFKKIYGRCLECLDFDGHPHEACYNCD